MGEDCLIAIIDDDESVRVALVGLVRSLGYRSAAYATAEEFLAGGQVSQSAAIVADIQMPGLSGIELNERLAALGYSAPVIMITARTETDVEERALASGALCVLKKPFLAEALIDCLERALARGAAPR